MIKHIRLINITNIVRIRVKRMPFYNFELDSERNFICPSKLTMIEHSLLFGRRKGKIQLTQDLGFSWRQDTYLQ